MDPRTREGLDTGFGWCLACGDTWNWKNSFVVPIEPGVGKIILCMEHGLSMENAEILGHLESFFNKLEFEAKLRLDHDELKEIKQNRPGWIRFAGVAITKWRLGRKNNENPFAFWSRIGHPEVSVLDWVPSLNKVVETPRDAV